QIADILDSDKTVQICELSKKYGHFYACRFSFGGTIIFKNTNDAASLNESARLIGRKGTFLILIVGILKALGKRMLKEYEYGNPITVIHHVMGKKGRKSEYLTIHNIWN
ncbi:15888_t:CDS:2, partial [Dentiscutata heterogama]